MTGARQTNYGTRIDYILVDPALMDDSVTDCMYVILLYRYACDLDCIIIDRICHCWCSIQPERTGSDHCPVLMSGIVQLESGSDVKIAALCARNYVEFAGKQQDIKAFLSQTRVDPHKQEDRQQPEQQQHAFSFSVASSMRPLGTRNSLLQLKRRRSGATSNKPASRANQQQSIQAFFGQSKSPSTVSQIPSSQQKTPGAKPTRPSSTSFTINSEADEDEESINFEELLVGFETKRKAAEMRQLAWRQVLSGQPPKTPLCHCQQPTVLRTVLKTNDNWGRKFYVCTKPAVRTLTISHD